MGTGVVLAHDPRGGLADFEVGTGGLGDDLRVPASHVLTVRNAFAELYERMLYVAGLGAIGEIGVEVGIAELAAEPGVVPKQKGEQHEGQGEQAYSR